MSLVLSLALFPSRSCSLYLSLPLSLSIFLTRSNSTTSVLFSLSSTVCLSSAPYFFSPQNSPSLLLLHSPPSLSLSISLSVSISLPSQCSLFHTHTETQALYPLNFLTFTHTHKHFALNSINILNFRRLVGLGSLFGL